MSALIRQLGLESDVVLLGRIPQRAMPHVYEACDIFVFPSLCESFGFPMLEAMGTGLATVAAGTLVNREILGEAALFYPPLDAVAAADAILSVIKKRTLRSCLVEKARTRVHAVDWSWKRYGHEILRLLHES